MKFEEKAAIFAGSLLFVVGAVSLFNPTPTFHGQPVFPWVSWIEVIFGFIIVAVTLHSHRKR